MLTPLTLAGFAVTAAAQESRDLSPQDVKRFLDPTALINGIDYAFEASFLPLDIEAYTHTISATWALSHWTALWADVPISHFSIPDEDGPSGVGDIVLGWGGILHEDLERRLTSSVAAIEVLVPAGSAEEGTGSGRWVLAPQGAIALNPTDVFPVYLTAKYFHSVGGSEGDPVRSLELAFETAHILPKGFYVAALPTLFFDFEHDVRFFSLGLGVGRALTQNFAWGGAYVQHLVGDQTFSRGFSVSLSFIWGDEKVAPP